MRKYHHARKFVTQGKIYENDQIKIQSHEENRVLNESAMTYYS